LHNVHTPVSHRIPQLDLEVVITETGNVRFVQWDAKGAGNTFCQWSVGTSTKKSDFISRDRVLGHSASSLRYFFQSTHLTLTSQDLKDDIHGVYFGSFLITQEVNLLLLSV